MKINWLLWSVVDLHGGLRETVCNVVDLKLAIGWNRFNLQLLGVWPDPHLEKEPVGLSRYRFLIPGFFMFGFIFGPQTANLFLIWGNIDLVTENLATANIPVANALIKLLVVWYRRNDLKPLLSTFFEDWRVYKTESERIIMRDSARLAKRISVGCTVLTQLMVTLYLVLRTVAIVTADRDQLDQDRIVLYPAYFPYNVRSTPVLQLTCMAQIISAYSATVSYTGVDSFISMLVLHTCAQFTILRKKLERLVDEISGMNEHRQFHKRLVWIVRRHEHLNWFAKNIEESFNFLLLMQMLFCTIQLCFQGYQAFRIITMDVEGELLTVQLIFLAFFVCFIVVHIYIYCYVGEKLLVESGGMRTSAYETKWFDARADDAKCLLFIMHRCTFPLRLTAGKFSTFSMEMFSSILRTSLGYLSVLLTVASG